MTPPPDGTSPWVWLLGIAVFAAATVLVAWLTNRPMRRKLGEVARNARVAAQDARIARKHTENEHADAEYPNLRDELTATREAAEKAVAVSERAVELAEALAAGQKRHDSEIGGLRSDIRRDRDDTGRVADRLDGLGNEIRLEHSALARRLDTHLEEARERDERTDGRLAWIEHQQH